MSESCEIRRVGEIKINGLSDKLKIVGIDYQIGDLRQSSFVSVSLIDKDGVLEQIPLSVQNPMEIEIGNLSFLGYPIKEARTCSPNGDNIIQVDFVDGSFILDKIIVGLWGKHCEATSTQITVGSKKIKNWRRGSYYGSDPLVIVGDFVDPCGDDQLDVKVDPCDPCPEAPLELVREYEKDMKKIDCENLRELSILETEYSFNDLATAINFGWPPLRFENIGNLQGLTTYKANYSGTLREVLNSWCSDLGLSYYWQNGIIKFIDLRAGIEVDIKGLDGNCDVVKIQTSRSLESTYSNNVIGYFGREGQERDYQCNYEFGKRIVCRPLNLKDLLSPVMPLAKVASAYVGMNGSSPNEWALDKYDLTEFLCMCSMYSPRLREAVVWLNVYGIVQADAAFERVETSKSVSVISGVSLSYTSYFDMDYNDDLKLGKSSLPLLDMTIKKVFSKTQNTTGFNWLVEILGGEIQTLVNGVNVADDDYYFFVGNRNDEKFSNRYEWESGIGSEFLGKFFIRKYGANNGNAPQVTAAGGDGAQYYERGDIGLDFSKFFTNSDPDSYVDELSNEEGEIKNSLILVERNPVWIPTSEEGDDLELLVEMCDKLIPAEVTKILSIDPKKLDVTHPIMKNDHPDAPTENGGWTENDTVYFVRKFKASKNQGALTISNLTTYDFHPKDKVKEVEIEGFQTPVKIGLRSTQAKKIQIENIVFWMPPQATVREQEGESESEHIPYAGGYYVFVNNNSSIESLLKVPKIEVIKKYLHPIGDNTLKGNMVVASLSESDLQEYYYDEIELGCSINESLLEGSIDDYTQPLRVNITKELIETSIEFNGIPSEDFEIENGFRSISVRFYGDSPVSNIVFRNSMPIPENLNVRLKTRKNSPLFNLEQKRRRWGKPPSEYPSEGGFPTI